ncbi:neutral zinc metallopeptidase [uncultured Bartonella sp.]|uniref:KPN_02809 family neutral zinc metallopeptidase n=1 Tax=uncultured Bartonella sp. TaxID=104108 RepID=UPI0026344DB6|nr:neutral zinc metallopeptidase [uncultured Bartonella sp.]
MRWEGGRQSDNIEDRRGEEGDGGRPVFRSGIGGLGFALLSRGGLRGVIIVGIIFLGLEFFGYSPTRFLFGDGALVSENSPAPKAGRPVLNNDRRSRFIATILGETEDMWQQIFQMHHATYKPPILVRFSGTISSPCGLASAAVGPFYCPADQKLYLDDAFFDELANRFGAPGEFAGAYVIAHEVGHHVQNLTGVLDKMNGARENSDTIAANAISVKIELQADCYAGVWAHSTEEAGLLEQGDIDSALNAAAKIGDDALQKQTQGYVVPDSFTHGTSTQRVNAFKQGYQSGKMEACAAL